MNIERSTTHETDSEIIKSMNEKQRRDHFILKNYPDMYDRVIEFSKKYNIIEFTKMLYHYVYNITEPILCKTCNKPTNFKGFNQGYNTYCLGKCAMNDPDLVTKRNEKTVETCMNKYGVSNVMKLDNIKEKVKKTSMDKYGVDNYSKTDEYKNKMIEYNNKLYGVDWYQQSEEFLNKSIKTCYDKYGVSHYTKTDEYKNNIKKSNIGKWGVDYYTKTDDFKNKISEYYNSEKFKVDIKKRLLVNKLKIDEYYTNYNDDCEFIEIDINGDVLLKCKLCQNYFTISKQLYYLRSKHDMCCCTICNPKDGKNISHAEKEVLKYIKTIYNGEIIENYKFNKTEIDIYLPDLNIGFEYNGLWFHGEYHRDTNYHINKLKYFNDIGINIFMIWEDDWLYKKDIIKSMILNKLSVSMNKIMARKCIIKEIKDNFIVNNFLENNHLQGKSNSCVKLGLYYNDNLVSIMTFGNLRKALGGKSKEGNWELIRFCNSLNTNVIGGASKLFKYFLKTYSPQYILSYADMSYSTGNLYKILGFDDKGNTKPNYYWCKDGKKYNRFSYRKDVLVKRGYDPNKTEVEIMHDLKYYKLYNCGNMKFEMRMSLK